MPAWIAIAAAAGAVAVAGRWWSRRVDGLGRPRPKPWLGAGVLLAAAAVAGVVAVRHHLLERRLGRAASALAGRGVGIRCQGWAASFVDPEVEPGYVRFGADGRPARSATVKADQCRHLAAYLRSSKRSPSAAEVVAVHLLTHEAMHLSGILSESQAECAAVQRDARTARLLGAPPAAAAALARAYFEQDFPRMPDEYRSPDCRPGGALDEGLADGWWAGG